MVRCTTRSRTGLDTQDPCLESKDIQVIKSGESGWRGQMDRTNVLCFVAGCPLVQPPKHTKSCSDCQKWLEHSTYTLRARTRQSKCNPCLSPEIGRAERVITCALNRVGSTLGTQPCLGLRMTLQSFYPNTRQDALTKSDCKSLTRLTDAEASRRSSSKFGP